MEEQTELQAELQKETLRGGLQGQISEDEIQEMLVLAQRLREQSGGVLDDDAIIAVAEATGTSVDWVRLAVHSVPQTAKKETVFDRLKASYFAFSAEHRRIVLGGVIGLAMGMTMYVSAFTRDEGGLWSILSMIAGFGAIANAALSRTLRTAIISGALAGAAAILLEAGFFFITNILVDYANLNTGTGPFLFYTLGGAFFSAIAFSLFKRNREKLGLHDPAADRHALIQQLMEIQSQLKSDEKFVTFLSVDMVGSTRIKSENDPLSVEYTFNEYHTYVQSVVTRYGGKIHSTAGDGVTAVFEEPKQAFQAGKSLQAGLFEFNAFRNKLAKDVELRAGLHTGNVLAPGKDSTSVNFAHVIDIAAHMQKEAPIGGLAVSEKTAMYFGGLRVVSDEEILVDDVKAAIWRPRRRVSAEAVPAAGPPAMD